MKHRVAAHEGPAEAMRRRLARLMAGRLLLALLAFGLALLLVGAGRQGAEIVERGLYGTLALAFGVTAACAALLPFVKRLTRLAAAQLVTDIGIVTSLLVFSGGGESFFSFLYLPITVYGAIFFGRAGAYGSAAASSVCYGGVLAALPMLPGVAALPPPEQALALWGVNSGALALVALLSSALAREAKLAEERLDASQGHLRALRSLHELTVECLTSGLLTTDGAAHITSFNPEAESILGRPAAEVVGEPLSAVLPGAERLVEAASTGKVRARLEFEGTSGTRKHLGISTSVLRDQAESSVGTVVIFQDVTEVVRLEDELRRNARLAGVGQLAADIAHEIRNPLAAISGSIEVLRSEQPEAGDGEGGRLMDIVLREVDRLDALITDFLLYARPAPPKLQSIAVGELLGEVVAVFKVGVPEDVIVELQVEDGLRVQGDEAQLRQVVWNLLQNAFQALEDGGSIQLAANASAAAQAPLRDDRSAQREDSLVVEIAVTDSGRGIAPEVVERVFDPFFTTKQGGTGLGLAMVHRIVESHSGVIQLESNPGEGTTVRILLAESCS